MAISRKYIITVDGYNCKLSSPLTFYRNDALHLIFSINEYGVTVKNGVTSKQTMTLRPLSAILMIETPENKDYIESTMVVDDEIHFHIDGKYTNFIGVSRMQIVLTDENCCQVTLPEFKFEVRNNIYDAQLYSQDIFLVDENDNNIVTEEVALIDVGDNIGNTKKEIRDLSPVNAISGTEDMILQDEDGFTKRVKTSVICTSVIDEISNPFTINMNSNVKIAELGSVIENLVLTWDYNREIVSQFLDEANLGLSVREQSFKNITSDRTFTMVSKSKMGVEKTINYTISFANGIYYGKSSEETVNADFFNTLTKTLSNNKSRSIIVNAEKGEYIYYCYPVRLGENAIFTVNGFDGGFNKIAIYALINANGYTEDYVIYKSTNANLGNTSITIK